MRWHGHLVSQTCVSQLVISGLKSGQLNPLTGFNEPHFTETYFCYLQAIRMTNDLTT